MALPRARPEYRLHRPLNVAKTTPAQVTPLRDQLETLQLVTRAEQTGARIRFVEDPVLLKKYGGR